MKAFIVDDEEISRNTLRYMIDKYFPEIKIIGEAGDFTDAVINVQKLKPDILFLDINLGGGKSGFSLLDALKGFDGAVIFITAYQDYALKAFKYSAVHYLLKPIDPIDLVDAVNRISNNKPSSELIPQQIGNLEQKVALPYKNGLEMVLVDDIIYLEAEGSYCKVHIVNDKIVSVSKNLKFVLSKLKDHEEFIRIHKSYVVNKKHITAYLRTDGGQLELTTKSHIPVSMTYKADIVKMFQ